MDLTRIPPLTELDVDAIVLAAGGRRAYDNADTRSKLGADYLLGEAIIEMKSLDEEGLAKIERQRKLAALFSRRWPDRPVIVLDRSALPDSDKPVYDRILEGPIKTALAKARKQLKQTRQEYPGSCASIWLVINNGYTALDHTSVLRMVAHRARQDSREIDGVVVAGCYFQSDFITHKFTWPIDYVPINVQRPFASFEMLRSAWNAFAERFMTRAIHEQNAIDVAKMPVVDTQFDVDGVTYVKPAPRFGKTPEPFRMSQRQKGRATFECIPPVALTFPDMTLEEWCRIKSHVSCSDLFGSTYEEWRLERAAAAREATVFKPFVPVPVSLAGWLHWCTTMNAPCTASSLCEYANDRFDKQCRVLYGLSRERSSQGVIPSRYILVDTELIGQDQANDVSHIVIVQERPHEEPMIHEIVTNARIHHEHGLLLACAHGVAKGIESVLWQKDLRYAWI